jgi:predicted DNA-binding transcriptional regulator AlpA
MGNTQDWEHTLLARQVAALLGCSVWTVHNMANDGRLKPIGKLPGDRGAYLFDRADVEAFAASRSAAVGGDAA